MTRSLLVTLTLCLAAAAVNAAPPARTMYAAAQARETAIRAAWDGPDAAAAPTLQQVRAAIAAYEALVRDHPTSGYADNALWQAAGLSLEAYARFKDDHDRDKARQFFHWLAAEYPVSPFVPRARAAEQRLQPDAPSPTQRVIGPQPVPAAPPVAKAPAPLAKTPPPGAKASEPAPPSLRARSLARTIDSLPAAVSTDVQAWLAAPATSNATSPVIAPEAIVPGADAANAAPSASHRGGYSMARQLGLAVSRIVIDPGHGGHDPGAGGAGVTEAAVVLDVALRLERLLKEQPGVEVVLTRRTDEYVSLEDRTAIANRERADLFLSIHANASKDTRAHGIESYFLDFAPTPAAAAIAARENAVFGKAMSTLPEIVRSIALNNKADESRELAAVLEQSMARRLKNLNRNLMDHGVKRAPFVVLIGAVMPSVLVEISFITNPREAQLLRGDAYRQRVAEALLDGVLRYQKALRSAQAISYHP
jgi:N-acetylmuramoyl-L-alanine amidase